MALAGLHRGNWPFYGWRRFRLKKALTGARKINIPINRAPRSVNNLALHFFSFAAKNRLGEALSTGPSTGLEIFVRGVRTYSRDES